MWQNKNGASHEHPDTIHSRFIGDDEITPDETDQNVTILFSVKEEVGALSKCLKIFEVLTMMVFKDVKAKEWKFLLVADVEFGEVYR